MALKRVSAKVYWEKNKEKNLPHGNRYITVSRFPEDKNWPEEAWSIVLEFEKSPKEQGNPSKATVSFLAKAAPIERLTTEKEFELYEGKNLVARVKVEKELL